jgi:hypothetical protein
VLPTSSSTVVAPRGGTFTVASIVLNPDSH